MRTEEEIGAKLRKAYTELKSIEPEYLNLSQIGMIDTRGNELNQRIVMLKTEILTLKWCLK